MRFPKYSGKWLKVSFLSLASVKARIGWQGLRQEEFMDSGDYYLITGTDFIDNRIDFAKCKYISKERFDQDKNIQIQNGDILITKDGSIGKVAFVFNIDKPATLNAGVYVVRITNNAINTKYLFHYLKAPFLLDFANKTSTGGTIKHLNQNVLGEFEVPYSCLDEQVKISNFFDRIDARITTQSKIIKDLIALKHWIIHRYYDDNISKCKQRFSNYISQISTRNTSESIKNVLSVSNKNGFVKQSEQFDDREIASDDKHNYKIVEKNDFAYNPARINVGSIARMKSFENGIVSPMYICFRSSDKVLPEYLDYYFQSGLFFTEMSKRLEGSVRQCLSYEALSGIMVFMPSLDEQKEIIKKLNSVENKIELEKKILLNYQHQKKYLLSNMFI